MKDKEDTENYKAVLSNCCLYIKVAKMSDTMYQQIESRYKDKPVTFQFRKFVAKPITLSFNNALFTSGNLFPDSEAPDKMLFALVYSDSLTGNMTTNPFEFPRRFTVTKDSDKVSIEGKIENAFYKNKIVQLEMQQKARDVQFFKLMSLFKDEFRNLKDKNVTEPSCVASGSKGPPPPAATVRPGLRKKIVKKANPAKGKQPLLKRPRTSRDGSEDSENFRECRGGDDDDDEDDDDDDDDEDYQPDDNDVVSRAVSVEKSDFPQIDALKSLGDPVTVYLQNFKLEVNSASLDQVQVK